MRFLRNVWFAVKTTPKKECLVALIVPGGFLALFLWILIKSAYRILKRKYDKAKTIV